MILGMDCLSAFYMVIDYRKKSIVFEIPDHLVFMFVGCSSQVEPTEPAEFKACPMKHVLAPLESLYEDP